MKKVLLLTLIFTLSLNNYAQLSGKVTYTASFDYSEVKNDIDSKKYDSIPDKKEMLLQMISKLGDVSYELNFNKNESIYKKEEAMDVDNTPINLTSILAGNDIIYTNLKSIIRESDTYGEIFLIHEKKLKWTLLNEQKKIGEYLCFKAIATKKITSNDGVSINKEVVAWYTLEIPFRFGPSVYSGLPGLILELKKFNKITYKATDISIYKTDKIIQKPEEGKEITAEKFDEIGLGIIDSTKD